MPHIDFQKLAANSPVTCINAVNALRHYGKPLQQSKTGAIKLHVLYHGSKTDEDPEPAYLHI